MISGSYRGYALVRYAGSWKAYTYSIGWGNAAYQIYGDAWFEAETPEELRELIDNALAELPEPVY